MFCCFCCDLSCYDRLLFIQLLMYITRPFPETGLTSIILVFGYLSNILYNKKCYDVVLILTMIDTVTHLIISVNIVNNIYSIIPLGIKIFINCLLIIFTHKKILESQPTTISV
jgi:hypothetical protein